MDEHRIDLAQEIYRQFLAPTAEEAIEIINDDIIQQCKERLTDCSKDVFASCTAVVRGYLAGEPFNEYQNSMFPLNIERKHSDSQNLQTFLLLVDRWFVVLYRNL